jgi:hypothetical protein
MYGGGWLLPLLLVSPCVVISSAGRWTEEDESRRIAQVAHLSSIMERVIIPVERGRTTAIPVGANRSDYLATTKTTTTCETDAAIVC